MTWTHSRTGICLATAASAVIATGMAVTSHAGAPLLLVNESPSVPRGLYLRDRSAVPATGELVTLAQPPQAQGYLGAMGFPPELRLLKRIAATGGERVCGGAGWLRTPGRTVPVLRHDRTGRELSAWQGCRRLAADEVLLLGDTPESFDGRYFGPVPRSALQAKYREVMTW